MALPLVVVVLVVVSVTGARLTLLIFLLLMLVIPLGVRLSLFGMFVKHMTVLLAVSPHYTYIYIYILEIKAHQRWAKIWYTI